MITIKRANGQGTIVKMTGNRRKPYAVRKVIGWKEDGRPILKYISYHKSYREAERALNKYNEDPYAIKRITLDELYKEWYREQEKEKAPGTLRSYRIRYSHLEPLHDTLITKIDAFTLENVYELMDVSSGTLEDVQILVSLMFKYAVKRKYLPVSALNISKAINMPTKETKRLKPHSVIDKTDIDKLWNMVNDSDTAKTILFYIYTGLRFSELKNLDPDDWHENYIEIKQAKTAAGIRIVPICDKLQPLLPLKPVPPRSTFERYFKMLLPDHAIHDTRHTFISMLTDKEVDVRVIKSIVGHRISDVTAIYTHISLDKMLDAVNML